jgi:hypothetical protein
MFSFLKLMLKDKEALNLTDYLACANEYIHVSIRFEIPKKRSELKTYMGSIDVYIYNFSSNLKCSLMIKSKNINK